MAAKSLAKHISETSSSEEIFKTSIKIYSKAPIESSFTDDLKYSANEAQQLDNEEKKRKKILICFNSSFSKEIKY